MSSVEFFEQHMVLVSGFRDDIQNLQTIIPVT